LVPEGSQIARSDLLVGDGDLPGLTLNRTPGKAGTSILNIERG
jgi:hypothetical protein